MSKVQELIEEFVNDPNYIIYENGTIWSKITERWLGHVGEKGYLMIGYKYGRLFVHRIIYRKFQGPLDPEMTINHIDGIKTHNDSSNLEQVTQDENNEHALNMGLIPKGDACGKSKLTEADVRIIKAMFPNHTLDVIANQFNVHKNTIKSIKYGRTWKHVN